MTPYELALKEIGTKEVVGIKHNAKVLKYFEDAGHGWVKDDETAWCAAFMGAMLRRGNVVPSGSLLARSYLDWGDPVSTANARPGDVAVFKRGTSSWQGHVAFFEALAGGYVQVLGGNQTNQVSRAKYPVSDLLGIRRAKGEPPIIDLPAFEEKLPDVKPAAPVGGIMAALAAGAAALWFIFERN